MLYAQILSHTEIALLLALCSDLHTQETKLLYHFWWSLKWSLWLGEWPNL